MTENLVTFLHDANHFAVAFREVIETSVAHIYLSALPSVHKTSKIAEVFMPKYPSLIRINAQGIQQQRTPLLELRGHTNGITSVGFSSDGTHIVSGSWDKTIRIWDARTGEEVMKPLKGHTDFVTSVGFSPDGTHIVSGSWDKTIRIWDARTGEEVMKPLKGHTSTVTSVGFSPDGTHIVSGSRDKTIRIWDARTGEEVMKPLKGHTERHLCWLLSRWDPHRVGLWDKTIRIWDARTGEEVMKPLKGHTDHVTSVGFSPDGTHIVSGSWDKTIRIWDARTGEEVMKPLKGHTDTSPLLASLQMGPTSCRALGQDDPNMGCEDRRGGHEASQGTYGLNTSPLLASLQMGPTSCRALGQDDPNMGCEDRRGGHEASQGTYGVRHLCWLLSRWDPHRVGLLGQDDPNMGCEDRRGGHEASQGTYGRTSPLLASLQMGPTSCRALGTRRSEYGMRGQARRS
jgi:WD40 repeat protein